MISTKTVLKINAALFISYGIGFIFFPKFMGSMYLNNPSAPNDYAYWIMKYGGVANVAMGLTQLIIADGTPTKVKKSVACIIGVTFLVNLYNFYNKRHWIQDAAYIQILVMNFSMAALNFLSRDAGNPKRSKIR